ncbi:MAG: gliding motility-associated C-terminal domain-containing protein [Bacteroidota bacterium]
MIKFYYIIVILAATLSKLNSQSLSVNFTKAERVCELAKASVNIISGATPIHYEWSSGSISNSVEDLQPGEYSVKIRADNNKDTTIYFIIETLVCEPNPENHFTPNNDDFNDTWNIARLENFPEFELFVYNRWGQLVHYQVHSYTPWDGRSLGLSLPDATYYYILYSDKSNKKNFIKGGISIIR